VKSGLGVEPAKDGLSLTFSLTLPFLDQQQRQLLEPSLLEVLGRGRQDRGAHAMVMSRSTMSAGPNDPAKAPVLGERIRRSGAGPKRKTYLDSEPRVVFDTLVRPESSGDPISPPCWSQKSMRVFAAELTRDGHQVGADLINYLLQYLGCSLRARTKITER